jgi:DinB superfamily
MSQRLDEPLARLRKGGAKTTEIFNSLAGDQWQRVVYTEPYPWNVRDLLAHFYSAEVGLLRLMQDIAAGGPGAPEDFDYNEFNAAEHKRLAGIPPAKLITDLAAARESTITWVSGLTDAELDRTGRHPALGVVSVEVFLTAIYAHQLMHMRDLARVQGA